eukprot:1142688-Pelagomonas_calceolata.AAC.6
MGRVGAKEKLGAYVQGHGTERTSRAGLCDACDGLRGLSRSCSGSASLPGFDAHHVCGHTQLASHKLVPLRLGTPCFAPVCSRSH